MADPRYTLCLPCYCGYPNPASSFARVDHSYGNRTNRYDTANSSDFESYGKAQKDASGSTKDDFISDFIKEHPEVRQPIQQLHRLHSLQQGLSQQLQQEIHDLEKKYNSRYQELYWQRAAIINASASCNFQNPRQAPNGKGIPSFWLKAMENNSAIDEVITKEDRAALKFLKDIHVEYLGRPGFVLHFDFGENPFFYNKSLRKTYMYERETDHFASDLVYGEAVGDEIYWMEGKDLTKKTYVVNGEAQGSIEVDSFFNFFNTSGNDNYDEDEDEGEDNGGGDDEDNEVNEDDDEDEEWHLGNDFALGEKFKDDLIPYALYWYTGEAVLYEEDEAEEYGEDEKDDGDEDDRADS